MPWLFVQDIPLRARLKSVAESIFLVVSLGALSFPGARAGNNPANALQAEFAAAKASLAAGDLASAEKHYIQTITLGLRQVAQLSLSTGRIEQATAYMDSAIKFSPGDVDTEVDAATVYFSKGEVDK